MREISIFERRFQVQSLFVQREWSKPQISSPNFSDTASLSTKPGKTPSRKPELIPFYDEFARIRSQPFRSSGSLRESLYKGLFYKLWKDVREDNQKAVLEDIHRWVRAVWTHESHILPSASQFSQDIDLHMKETAVWKGRLVDLEFHLELHLEQKRGLLFTAAG